MPSYWKGLSELHAQIQLTENCPRHQVSTECINLVLPCNSESKNENLTFFFIWVLHPIKIVSLILSWANQVGGMKAENL